MNKKIKLGILGGGGDSLIGILHRIAASMYDNYQLIGGVFSSNYSDNIAFAEQIGIYNNRIYKDLDIFIEEELKLSKKKRIEAVAILTPNFLHFPMAKKLLEAGFHIICEKPMTTTFEEAQILQKTIKKFNTIFAVTYTYTGYPMVRQMKEMIEKGAIGKIQKIDVQYYQGWINPIIHDKERRTSTWRLNPEKSGVSCCLGDIGTHGFNMIEYVTGMEVKSILADLNYLYTDNKMDIDGTILLRFAENIKGILRASQIATGEENNFTVSIYGDKGGLKWAQENPNYLYYLTENEPLKLLKPGHAYNSKLSLYSTKLPAGHPEGIFDAMGNIYKGIAKAIRKEKYHSGEFPTINDGARGMNFIEKAVASHQQGNIWISI